MSFEVWLQADSSQTGRLPSPADVAVAFSSATVRPRPDGDGVIVEIEAEAFDVAFDQHADVVDHISVDRPTDAQPLWEGMYSLLRDFDMFMYWPGEQLIAAVARPDVPLPEDMPAQRAVVRSPDELRSLVAES
jgi:hypothetical protein